MKHLGLPHSDVFRQAKDVAESKAGFSLAQKMVGRACGVKGHSSGRVLRTENDFCRFRTPQSPMTRDELKDLACLGFSADLVMQSFCHTAAYPKPVDVNTHHTLPDFIMNRGGVALRPGDGVIHCWLNRLLLPIPSVPVAIRTPVSRSAFLSRRVLVWWHLQPQQA